MYKRQQKGWLKHFDFIVLDLLSLAGSYVLAYYLRHGNIARLFINKVYISTGILLMIFDLLVVVLFETMQNILRRAWYEVLTAVIKENLIVFGCAVVYLFSVKDGEQMSRITLWLTMLLHILSGFLAFMGWRRVIIVRQESLEKRTMLLVADRASVRDVLARFRSEPVLLVNIVGVVLADADDVGGDIDGVPVVATLRDAAQYICHEWIDAVYVCTAIPPRALIGRCNEMGVTVHRELHTVGSTQQFVEELAGQRVLTDAMNSATPGQLLSKRVLDILGGVVGSVIALVIIAIFGPQIKRASPGPILFRQERVGHNGKHFNMLKLRTMVPDAEARKAALTGENRVADGMMFKVDFDPRIIGNEILPDGTRRTGLGEFLRRTSLDEFPQFFNVLLGQMSLVGTRPPTLDEWEKYEYHHRARLATKPGVTGLWQISGRSHIVDFEEVVKLDTEYINNWSLWLDIKILLKTIVCVIKRDGAM